jgi:hypothetical protein
VWYTGGQKLAAPGDGCIASHDDRAEYVPVADAPLEDQYGNR